MKLYLFSFLEIAGDTRQLGPYFELSDIVLRQIDTFPILAHLLRRSPLDVAVKVINPHQLIKSFRLPPKQMEYLMKHEYSNQPGLSNAVGLGRNRTSDGETQYLWLTPAGGSLAWGTSMYNPGHELCAFAILSSILSNMDINKSPPKEIAILCFYEGQVKNFFIFSVH